MGSIKAASLFIIIILALLGFASVYTVHEGQEALVLRFGKLEKNPSTGKVDVKQPGLHFKLPFIEKARKFDTRLQTLDIQSSRIVTAEKKDVLVDYYVKWRINNLPLYFKRTGGDAIRAGNLLQKQLNDSLRAEFGKRTIKEVVSDDRSKIMNALLQQANTSTQNLGVKVIDVRIKRIDLPTAVSSSVYARMRAERERVATGHRSEGKAKAEAIRAGADATVTVTLATAKTQAAKIRAMGEAKATTIYAKAYQQDPGFYAFYRSIMAYQQVFNSKNDIIVLRPNSQFFKYFNTAQAPQASG